MKKIFKYLFSLICISGILLASQAVYATTVDQSQQIMHPVPMNTAPGEIPTTSTSDATMNAAHSAVTSASSKASELKDQVANKIPQNQVISDKTKSQLVDMKDKELKSIEDYTAVYGSRVYGTVAYILNKIRIYSIPVCFLGIALSAIHQYIIGNRHLEEQNKGFNSMITIVTLFIICQVLPLVFAIVVKGWR